MSMSMSATRAVLRQSTRLTGRTTLRCESTTTKAADAAKDGATKASATAAEYTAKASAGLSKATAAAGPALASAAKGLSSTLGRVGGRTGKFIAFLEARVPAAIYYTRVGIELSKLVIQGQKMSPPSIATFQSYYQSLMSVVKNPSSISTGPILAQVRSMKKPELVAGSVVLAEVLGFFTVGEMIGRFKIIGYRGEPAHH